MCTFFVEATEVGYDLKKKREYNSDVVGIYIYICVDITVLTIAHTGAPSFAYHPNRT